MRQRLPRWRVHASAGRAVPLGLLTAALLLTGCASRPVHRIEAFPPLAGPAGDAAAAPIRAPDEILAVTDAMRAFIERNVAPRASTDRRIRQLTRAILHPGTLGVRYQDHTTRTAAETFDTANGNCLSLSMLFASMAREAGIEARFYEVNVVPEWSLAGDVVFATRHVNVGGRIASGDTYVMDFSPYIARRELGRRRMTDEEAIAHYYNNVGATYLASGELQSARQHFVAGLRQAPDIGFLWSNLSVVYSRNGQLDAAEMALDNAVALDDDNTSAMSNLARLLRARGDTEAAMQLSRRIAGAQRENPYYQFAMGERHLAEQRYEEALVQIEVAIQLEPGEPLFYRKAAQAAAELDRVQLAEQYATLAARLAEDERKRQRAWMR